MSKTVEDAARASACCALCRGTRATASLGALAVFRAPGGGGGGGSARAAVTAHANCAELSPLFATRGAPHEAQRGERLACRACKVKGATIGCANANCQRGYHAQCAADAGARFDAARHADMTGGLFCAKHVGDDEAAGAVAAAGAGGGGLSVAAWADAARACRAARDREAAGEAAAPSSSTASLSFSARFAAGVAIGRAARACGEGGARSGAGGAAHGRRVEGRGGPSK